MDMHTPRHTVETPPRPDPGTTPAAVSSGSGGGWDGRCGGSTPHIPPLSWQLAAKDCTGSRPWASVPASWAWRPLCQGHHKQTTVETSRDVIETTRELSVIISQITQWLPKEDIPPYECHTLLGEHTSYLPAPTTTRYITYVTYDTGL